MEASQYHTQYAKTSEIRFMLIPICVYREWWTRCAGFYNTVSMQFNNISNMLRFQKFGFSLFR